MERQLVATGALWVAAMLTPGQRRQTVAARPGVAGKRTEQLHTSGGAVLSSVEITCLL